CHAQRIYRFISLSFAYLWVPLQVLFRFDKNNNQKVDSPDSSGLKVPQREGGGKTVIFGLITFAHWLYKNSQAKMQPTENSTPLCRLDYFNTHQRTLL
ncbi:hypothetical protein B0F90DRAFT_1736713, partial [Multifurca ochricompacta]